MLEIDELKFVLGQGNFVLKAAKGSAGVNPIIFYDLSRLANGKIAEYWDTIEAFSPASKWNSSHGTL